MRFRELETNLLYDAKMMSNGVICRQCPPREMNIFFLDFEEFADRFEVSNVQFD